MSFYIPYSISSVISYFSDLFSLDLSTLTDYQSLILTLISNLYFFAFWFFIIYVSLKGLNWVYERLF